MTRKHPFSDYEPVRRVNVTRPAASESVPDEEQEFVSDPSSDPPLRRSSKFLSDSSKETIAQSAGNSLQHAGSPPLSAVAIEQDRPAPESRKEGSEKWILKRGHALSFAGVFVFTAFVFFRPYELFPALSWLSSSAFWVALLTLAVFIPTQLGLEGHITARPREVNLALLLLLAGILSIPFSLEPARGINSFSDFFKVVMIFIVMVNVIRSEKRLRKLWVLVLIASCILSVGAIYDYRAGKLALQGVRIQGVIGGLFDNPNDLALHLVTMIPLALAMMLSSRSPLTKAILLACVVVLLGGVVATFSRGGFLGLICASGVFLWKCARRSRLLVGIVGTTCLVIFIVAAPGGYRTRLSTTGDDSSLARFDDLKRSIFIAIRHPLTGVGMDNYILFSNANKATHNAYTQVASEMGIAALILYVMFIVTPLKRLRKIERSTYGVKANRSFYYLAIGLQASLAAYMVASFFASVAYLWYIYYLVAYSIGLRRIYDAAIEKELAASSIPLTPGYRGSELS